MTGPPMIMSRDRKLVGFRHCAAKTEAVVELSAIAWDLELNKPRR